MTPFPPHYLSYSITAHLHTSLHQNNALSNPSHQRPPHLYLRRRDPNPPSPHRLPFRLATTVVSVSFTDRQTCRPWLRGKIGSYTYFGKGEEGGKVPQIVHLC